MTPTTDHPEPPCPGCGQGMEVQAVCERCGRREAAPDALREAFMAGTDALAAEQFGPGASVVWDADQCFSDWFASRTEGTP